GFKEPATDIRWNLATNEPGCRASRLTSWETTCSFDAPRTSTRTGWRSSGGRAQGSGSLKPASKDPLRTRRPDSGFGRARRTRKGAVCRNTTTNPTLACYEHWSYRGSLCALTSWWGPGLALKSIQQVSDTQAMFLVGLQQYQGI
ncbi:hypothetical protein THAOC_36484, partial [Thalassiosira oceanica]